MTITVDPEENEIDTLLNFVDLDGRRVLEIGSGDGRLTWSYAAWAQPYGVAKRQAREPHE